MKGDTNRISTSINKAIKLGDIPHETFRRRKGELIHFTLFEGPVANICQKDLTNSATEKA